jgi:hypothetical protein
LDAETEAALSRIRQATGLPVSQALKRGLRALQEEVARESARTPYDVFRELELGAGGDAIAPSTQSRRGVRRALLRKLSR